MQEVAARVFGIRTAATDDPAAAKCLLLHLFALHSREDMLLFKCGSGLSGQDKAESEQSAFDSTTLLRAESYGRLCVR